MKKIFILITLMMTVLLASCTIGNDATNKNTASQNGQKTTKNNPVDDTKYDFDFGYVNQLHLESNMEKAKTTITDNLEMGLKGGESGKKLASKKHFASEFELEEDDESFDYEEEEIVENDPTIGDLTKEELGLAGNLSIERYEDGMRNDSFYKTSAEPMSYAFGLLEYLMLSGYKSIDYSGKWFISLLNWTDGRIRREGIRITTYKESRAVVIDYGMNYHMVVGLLNDEPYVLSFANKEFNGKTYDDRIYFSYSSKYLMYNFRRVKDQDIQSQIEDLRVLIDYMAKVDGISDTALAIAYSSMIDENGNLIEMMANYDPEDPNYILCNYEKEEGYCGFHNIKNIYFEMKYDMVCNGGREKFEINDGSLDDVISHHLGDFYEIPEGVTTLNYLGEYKQYSPDEVVLPKPLSGILIPESLNTITDKFIESNTTIECIFFKTNERNEDLEERFKLKNPDVKFYYKDEWEYHFDIAIPNHYYRNEDDHAHNFILDPKEELWLYGPDCDHGDLYYSICDICGKIGYELISHGERIAEHSFIILGEEPRDCRETTDVRKECTICWYTEWSTMTGPHKYYGNDTCVYCGSKQPKDAE